MSGTGSLAWRNALLQYLRVRPSVPEIRAGAACGLICLLDQVRSHIQYF